MRSLVLSIVLLFIAITSHSQINDLDLVNMLIGKNIEDLDSILISTGYDYTITSQKGYEGVATKLDIYIDSQFGGVKLWELESQKYRVKGIYATEGYIPGKIYNYVSTIFVRYRNNNIGDLKDFKSYEIPKNDTIEYEKELGGRLSHLKVEYLKEDE